MTSSIKIENHKYWLFDWFERNKIQTIEQAVTLAEKNAEIEKMRALASSWQVPGRSPQTLSPKA